MPNAFIPLDEYLRAGSPAISAFHEIPKETAPISFGEKSPSDIPGRDGSTNGETLHATSPYDDARYDDVLSDIRCFQAKLADAFERKLDRLLRDSACEVLARELLTKPADLTEIVRRLLEDFREEECITVRVHPDDLSRFSEFTTGACGRQKLDLQIAGDDEVRCGDVFIELRDGSIDARLGVRLDTVLRNLTVGRDKR